MEIGKNIREANGEQVSEKWSLRAVMKFFMKELSLIKISHGLSEENSIGRVIKM